MQRMPKLNKGEIYLCGMLNADDTVTHTILLPTDAEKPLSWPKAMEWTKSLNGDLPTRSELVIAYEKHRDKFKWLACWSNTSDDGPDFHRAWCQCFLTGTQTSYLQHFELRALAVRRVTLST